MWPSLKKMSNGTSKVLRPAIHLSQNTRKWSWNVKDEKCTAGYFAWLFSRFTPPFFRILQHFAPGLAFTQKVKEFRGLFFRGINITQNSHEIRKVYSECFVFRVVFRENICEIPAKYEKYIAGRRRKRPLEHFLTFHEFKGPFLVTLLLPIDTFLGRWSHVFGIPMGCPWVSPYRINNNFQETAL